MSIGLTFQQYFMRPCRSLTVFPKEPHPIDIGFIDGNHCFNDVKHDFIEVINRTRRNSYILLHDTNIYIRELLRHDGVKRWLNIIKKDEAHFEVIDFPFSSGVALVRVLQDESWEFMQ